MSGKPTVTTGMIRRKIRSALNIRPGFGKTEEMLLEHVNELLGGGVSLQELRDGIEWNLSERTIRSEYIKESEETLWFITKTGQARENFK